MKTFLHEVAEDLYARYGEGLSERAILFPSRRARLFFVDALTGICLLYTSPSPRDCS